MAASTPRSERCRMILIPRAAKPGIYQDKQTALNSVATERLNANRPYGSFPRNLGGAPSSSASPPWNRSAARAGSCHRSPISCPKPRVCLEPLLYCKKGCVWAPSPRRPNATVETMANPGKAKVPTFSPAEAEGIRDYWHVYDKHYDRLQKSLMAMVMAHEELGPLIRAIPPQVMEEQNRASRERQRKAFIQGEWDD